MGDKIFLKVASFKNVVRFGRTRKLESRFIDPFEILKRIGKRAFCLSLSESIDHIHNVFHVSLFHKYIEDPTHVLKAKKC